MVSGWTSVCLSIRQSYVRPFLFPDDNWVNISGFSRNLVCVLLLRRSGLGLLLGKFRQSFTELSVHDTTMAGYYSLTFLFHIVNLVIFHPQYIDNGYLVSTTSHTILYQSFWNSDFMKVYRLRVPLELKFSCIIWEYACAFNELPLLISSTSNKHYRYFFIVGQVRHQLNGSSTYIYSKFI